MDNGAGQTEPQTRESRLQPEYVGFWIRFVAFLIDSVWALIAASLVAALTLGQPDIDLETISRDPAGTLALLSGRLLFDLAVVDVVSQEKRFNRLTLFH